MDYTDYKILFILLVTLRIIITIYSVNKAKILNRSRLVWGVLGFLIPLITFIWIQFLRPPIEWDITQDKNSDETYVIKQKTKETTFNKKRFKFRIGFTIILISILIIIDRFFPAVDFGDIWPFILIVIGVLLIIEKLRDKPS